MRTLFSIGFILIFATSCQEKFNSEKWKTEADLRTYPFREMMLTDIIENKKFIGLSFGQILDSLGQPTAFENGEILYSVKTDYGSDIDPIHTKNLALTIDKDSLVTDVRLKEWKK